MFSLKTLATSAPFVNLKNLPQPHVRCNRDLAAAGATSAGSSENFASIFKSGSTKVSCSSLCYCCCCCHIKQKVQSILWWKGKFTFSSKMHMLSLIIYPPPLLSLSPNSQCSFLLFLIDYISSRLVSASLSASFAASMSLFSSARLSSRCSLMSKMRIGEL